ncbi:hypothetical protein mru_0694 [Methanobrevibacter ruminantium M1]|uniref:Uncharacterized protein n=2 Tax=Methanobrevibacter ruminantium TaxID=83816 RepID=D3E1Y4_METRM|nr:hypothetical protein mru_0694 [Methanobrevibacter ruminantium M1]
MRKIILLAFSALLIILGLWNYMSVPKPGLDIIASSLVLVAVGWTLAMSVFEPNWIKAAIFIDGLVFVLVSITFLVSPINYVFLLFGIILVAIAVLAYLRKLPDNILRYFYRS